MSIPVNEIQRVMTSLANKATVGYGSASAYDKGLQRAYEDAIKMLERVIASEAGKNDDTHKSNGNGTHHTGHDQTDQV